MTEPEIPQKRPYPTQVEAGKEYHVCMCGSCLLYTSDAADE